MSEPSFFEDIEPRQSNCRGGPLWAALVLRKFDSNARAATEGRPYNNAQLLASEHWPRLINYVSSSHSSANLRTR